MPEKLVVGPIDGGLKTNREPFNIDNNSFPTLINAYQWRGRIKRKRGTSLLGRLQRFLETTDGIGGLIVTIQPVPILTGIASFSVGSNIFTDPGTTANPATQTLLSNGPGTATLNRVTGVLTITGSNATTEVIYFPTLPVMGLRDFVPFPTQFPDTIAFDTRYAYNINTDSPFNIYDVSFYKNPFSDPPYVAKTTWTPLWWNGENYQQFWTVNYQGALWATNGIKVPFIVNNIGMQYAGPTTIPALTAAVRIIATEMDFTIVGNPLVVGDFVFANEFTASAGGDAITLNFQTGYVITAGDTFTVKFPFANITAGTYTPGILQYLTNRSNTAVDNIRWYDGDPTNTVNPIPSTNLGWVNFMPPLSQGPYSIADLPPRQYYLVGARLIIPYKDRLLFLGPVVQTSTGNPIYLQDTVIYSQNGTPYYTASFTGDPSLANTVFTEILVPINQTATANAWWEDQTGFGGFLSAGIDQPITTVGKNEDVLIVGFSETQTRLVYSGNDVLPFSFYLINSELGSASPFSTITMDKGIMTKGSRSFTITSQTNAERFDLDIPDSVFDINLTNNGNERLCAQRDYINEWVYFTYPSDSNSPEIYIFPNQTLLYNYRDNSWAIFFESYTSYGQFRVTAGNTWATIGTIYETWSEWNDPWSAGLSTILEPQLIGGNQQGFVLIKDVGTGEGDSLVIQNIVGNIITSPDHGLNDGDYIKITGAKGTVSSQINGKIFLVFSITKNTFMLSPNITGSPTYTGGGLIQRFYIPYIQSRQFPGSWGMSRKTRIGPQQYLLSTTNNGQIQLLIFLSQNSASAYNLEPIIPESGSINNSLIYSTVLYTCTESTNLGLTPANTNLQMISDNIDRTAVSPQSQIWHRINTSLIGDTVQLGFTMSDAQMRSLSRTGITTTITAITLGNPTIITTENQLSAGQLVQITSVIPSSSQFNFTGNNSYIIISATTTDITIDVDSTLFTYTSGGTVNIVSPIIQQEEIEIHGFILEVSQSQMLC